MRAHIAAVASVSCLALAACGQVSPSITTGSGGGGPPVTTDEVTPRTSPGVLQVFTGSVLNLTARDGGNRYSVRRGTRVIVHLATEPTARPRVVWLSPATADSQVLRVESTQTDGAGAADGEYTAVRAGTTTITAFERWYCGTDQCATDSMWTVEIIVVDD